MVYCSFLVLFCLVLFCLPEMGMMAHKTQKKLQCSTIHGVISEEGGLTGLDIHLDLVLRRIMS